MRSPQDMQTIQIDITNACNKACSNCTRFCGNHKKPFFMDYDTFRRAVDSLDEFHGIVGVMGGEPTLHPEFERFVGYLREKFGERKEDNRLIYPQKEFIKEIHRREFESRCFPKGTSDDFDKRRSCDYKMAGPGLWSNMGDTYPRYYELIQDSFNVQFLNDHINPSFHQPGLVSRKDLGIPDEGWIPMRDACWIQNEWSATITPKGAFFCEIAGALDMLFDGPGGWTIEPGWWKRKPEEFGDQLHWCELCGFALHTFMRDAGEEVDDVSPTLYEMLKKVDSPRLRAGHTNLMRIVNGEIAAESRATTAGFADIAAGQPYIEHYEDRFNASNSHLLVHGYDVVSIPEGEGFGVALNKALSDADNWVLFAEADDMAFILQAKAAVDDLIKNHILNPGTMHIGDGFRFFSKRAISLREFGFDRIAHIRSLDELQKAWQQNKVVRLSEVPELIKWKRSSIVPGKRYVIWGTGHSGSFLAEAVEQSGGILVYAVDIDSSKYELKLEGHEIHSPEYLKEHPESYDYVLIGHYSLYDEICDQAVAYGIEKERILRPYEI